MSMVAESPLPSPGYATWLTSLKARIQSARISAARAANRELILIYWNMGRGIDEKQRPGLVQDGGGAAVRRSSGCVSRVEGLLRQQPLADAAVLYAIQHL
jgi:hypothetical protein